VRYATAVGKENAMSSTVIRLAITAMLVAALAPVAGGEPGCGAQKLNAYIGLQATDDVIAAIREASGAQTIRVLKPGMAVTMDYRTDRLNIDTDDKGVIKALRCS
jgi:hypothetical protein